MKVEGTTVSLNRVVGLTPNLTPKDLQAMRPQDRHRHYRGPVLNPGGLNDVCPYCGNAHIHDCPSCRVLTCCPDEAPRICTLCGHKAASTPLGDATLPEWARPRPETLAERALDWRRRIEERMFEQEHGNPWEEFERLRRERNKPGSD